MSYALPSIVESADDLKRRLRDERHPRKRQRLHLLFLIASRQVRSRSQLARVLGISRNTVVSWLTSYQHGGLDALLDLYVPEGKAPTLSPPQLEQLRARLAQPEGFVSYAEIQQWLHDTLAITMKYDTVHDLVHDRLGARPKVPRLSHEKKTTKR
jgi:transposase